MPSVAIQVDDSPVLSRQTAGQAHARDLLPALGELLAERETSIREIDTILIGTGPGSYTGLRVGIATALGLARATGAQVRAVPSGETLAYGRLQPGQEGVLLLDARQNQVYYAHYARTTTGVRVLQAPCVLSPQEALHMLPGTLPIFGDSTIARAVGLSDEQCERLIPEAVADAGDLLAWGLQLLRSAGPSPLEMLEPLYLRDFQAKPRKR